MIDVRLLLVRQLMPTSSNPAGGVALYDSGRRQYSAEQIDEVEAMPTTDKKATSTTGEKTTGFTAEERAAMKERQKELRSRKGDGEQDLLAKIAEMPQHDRDMAEKIHAIVKANAPELSPKTWYGMPAYAKDGKVVCFFQSAAKFGARYATFGFNDTANLDEGSMWATSFALKDMTKEDEATIAALVKRAVS